MIIICSHVLQREIVSRYSDNNSTFGLLNALNM